MNLDAQKKIFVDFENQMNDQAIAVNMGNFGLFQVATSKLKNFKAYRIPRMWGVAGLKLCRTSKVTLKRRNAHPRAWTGVARRQGDPV